MRKSLSPKAAATKGINDFKENRYSGENTRNCTNKYETAKLVEILQHAKGLMHFTLFCKNEQRSDLISFWDDVNQFHRHRKQLTKLEKAQSIADKFFNNTVTQSNLENYFGDANIKQFLEAIDKKNTSVIIVMLSKMQAKAIIKMERSHFKRFKQSFRWSEFLKDARVYDIQIHEKERLGFYDHLVQSKSNENIISRKKKIRRVRSHSHMDKLSSYMDIINAFEEKPELPTRRISFPSFGSNQKKFSFTQMSLQRKMVIKNLKKSEQTYVLNLKTLLAIRKELESLFHSKNITDVLSKDTKRKVSIKESLDKIFQNGNKIYELAKKLLHGIEEDEDFAHVLLKYIDSFRIYSSYSNGSKRAFQVLKYLIQTETIATIFETVSITICDGKEITFYLSLPINHLSVYQHALTQLKNNTPHFYPEYKKLNKVIKKMNQVMIREEPGVTMAKLKEIEDRIQMSGDFELVQPHRTFIREGNVLKESSVVGIGRKKPRHLLLFTDLLIWTTTKDNKYRGHIEFTGAKINNHKRDANCRITGFTVKNRDKSVGIICQSQEEKDEWVQAIQSAIDIWNDGSDEITEDDRMSIEEKLDTCNKDEQLSRMYTVGRYSITNTKPTNLSSSLPTTHFSSIPFKPWHTVEQKTSNPRLFVSNKKRLSLAFIPRTKHCENVSDPFSFEHKTHVDKNYNWCEENLEDKFTFLEEMGEGTFAKVFRAKHKVCHFEVAIKIIDPKKTKISHEIVKKEIGILQECRNANIVGYYGCWGPDSRGRLWILMEMCQGGSVDKVIAIARKHHYFKSHHDTEKLVGYIMRSILSALVYLQQRKIVHRDVKPENMLIRRDGNIKLADFGVSYQEVNSSIPSNGNTLVGSPVYLSPELWSMPKGTRPQHVADIWALGISALEIAEGPCSYHRAKNIFVLQRMIITESALTLQNCENWSNEFQDFVTKCLTKDPKKRPSASELLVHKFITRSPIQGTWMKPHIDRYLLMTDKVNFPISPSDISPLTKSDTELYKIRRPSNSVWSGNFTSASNGPYISKSPSYATQKKENRKLYVVRHSQKNSFDIQIEGKKKEFLEIGSDTEIDLARWEASLYSSTKSLKSLDQTQTSTEMPMVQSCSLLAQSQVSTEIRRVQSYSLLTQNSNLSPTPDLRIPSPQN